MSIPSFLERLSRNKRPSGGGGRCWFALLSFWVSLIRSAGVCDSRRDGVSPELVVRAPRASLIRERFEQKMSALHGKGDIARLPACVYALSA